MSRGGGRRRKPHWVTMQFLKMFGRRDDRTSDELTAALDGILAGSVHPRRGLALAERRIKLDDGRVLEIVPAQSPLGGTGARGLLRLAVEGLFEGRRSVRFMDPGEPVVCGTCESKFNSSVLAATSFVRQCGHRPARGQVTCDQWSAVLCGDGGECVALLITDAEARFVAGSGMTLADVLGFLARPLEAADLDAWARQHPAPRLPLSSAVLEVRRRSSSPPAGSSALVSHEGESDARAALELVTAHCGGVQELQDALEVLRRALR